MPNSERSLPECHEGPEAAKRFDAELNFVLSVPRPGDWGWHPAYQDTLDLRRKFESAINLLRERIPAGQTIVLYPCGCSAIGNLPVGEEMPLQCGSCPPHTSATSIVYRPHEKRPTIQDLEAILAQDGNGLPVRVLPNGQVI